MCGNLRILVAATLLLVPKLIICEEIVAQKDALLWILCKTE